MTSLAAGTRVGPYVLQSRIGRGGMGEVWRATDTRLDRSVAVKFLPSEFANDTTLKLRFQREAKSIGRLNHPHICALYDVGESDGNGYLVMELVDGETLADRLLRGPLPVEQALQRAIEIASALDRAHREGIIHRDLKPSNIILTASGAKLLDFGLAKPFVPSAPGDATLRRDALTEEGAVVGTLQYMAPEQVSGEAVDARADIFAFGAVLYEMLTGKQAFGGASRASVIAAIISSEVPPLPVVRPPLAGPLDRVVRTCLAKNPDDRWQTAHDLMLELRWITESGSGAVVAPPVAGPSRAWKAALVGVAILGAAAVIASSVAWLRSRHAVERTLRLSVAPPSGEELMPLAAGLSISPDGRYVTFATRPIERPTLWIRALDSREAHRVPDGEKATSPFWSPDSRVLAFVSGGRLRKFELTKTETQTIASLNPTGRTDEDPYASGGSWNRNGDILFVPGDARTIFRVPAGGGPAVSVTALAAGEAYHAWPAFLPDGKHFLYLSVPAEKGEPGSIRARAIDEDESRFLVRALTNAVYASGHLLYVSEERALVAHPFDAASLRFTGDPVPIDAEVEFIDGGVGAFAASEEGVLVFHRATSAATTLGVADSRGTQVETLATGDLPGRILATPFGGPGLALSPDERRLVFTTKGRAPEATTLWVYDLERRLASRLPLGAADPSAAVWSPDGTSIAFAASAGQARAIWLKDLSSRDPERVLLGDRGDKTPTSWSPDGQFLLFETADDVSRDVRVLPLFGNEKPYALFATRFNEGMAEFSPDGRLVAFASDESGRWEVYVAPFDRPEAKVQASRAGAMRPAWEGSGESLAFGTLDRKVARVSVAFSGGTVRIGEPVVSSDRRAETLRLLPFPVVGRKSGLLYYVAGAPPEPSIDVVTNWPALKRGSP
ncbi:MAG TPA: protein kinase [Thermoanaerobaculia bacterium]